MEWNRICWEDGIGRDKIGWVGRNRGDGGRDRDEDGFFEGGFLATLRIP
jgi:hypothetical protein